MNGGEGGIRTPDTLLGCNCLAGSPVRPLQHLSVGTAAEFVKIVKRAAKRSIASALRALRICVAQLASAHTAGVPRRTYAFCLEVDPTARAEGRATAATR